jgi:hypothetical protein
MPKSKNNRKKKNSKCKISTNKTCANLNKVIEHSPNAMILADLINKRNLHELSLFIQELFIESQYTFDQDYQEWLHIYKTCVFNDLELALNVAKCLYYHAGSAQFEENFTEIIEQLSEHIWSSSSDRYKKECIGQVTVKIGTFGEDIQINVLHTQRMFDSCVKFNGYYSEIQETYTNVFLQKFADKQKINKKIANF